MGMGSFDVSGLKELQKQLEKQKKSVDSFVESCAKELAARLLRMVVKRTPVGDIKSGSIKAESMVAHCGVDGFQKRRRKWKKGKVLPR